MKKVQLKPFKAAKLYTRKGDLSKRWYVGFGAWNDALNRIEGIRAYCPAEYKTKDDRERWAKTVCSEINALLSAGYKRVSPKELDTDSENRALKPLTINQVFDLAIVKAQSLRKKTQSTYIVSLNKFRKWLGPNAQRDIDAITKSKVSEYSDFLLASGLSSATVNNQLNAIRIMVGKVFKAGYISSNPFQYEKLTETESFSNVAFTPEHQELIENYLKENNYPLFILTRLMYYSFIRPKEIRDLRVRDFNFMTNSLTITGEVSKSRKTNTIPIHTQIVDLLKEYRQYPSKFYICGKHFKPGVAQMAENAAYVAHRAALEALNLYDGYEYTLYSWRHTGAINAYLAGTDIKTLQFLFRHTSVSYTEIYLKSLKLQLMDIEFKSW